MKRLFPFLVAACRQSAANVLPKPSLLLACYLLIASGAMAAAADSWPRALAQMPLGKGPLELTGTNCVGLLLGAFKSNETVKALVFMPGATDEFFLFHRARAVVDAPSISLMDAVAALTNQTEIRAHFRAPFLLLHTVQDLTEPEITMEDDSAGTRFHDAKYRSHVLYNDRDWGVVQAHLAKSLKAAVYPSPRSRESWHFYRHSLAAWNLTGWEAIEAIALAGKTSVSITRHSSLGLKRHRVIFVEDKRPRESPALSPRPR